MYRHQQDETKMRLKSAVTPGLRRSAVEVALALMLATGMSAGCETAGAAEDDKACCKLAAMERCECTSTSAAADHAVASGDPILCNAILAEDLDGHYASAQEACELGQYAEPGCYERIMQNCE